MGMHIKTAALMGTALRGVQSVRAEAPAPSLAEIKAMIEGVNKTFAEFKTENTEALAKKADVVTTEKVERINAAVGEMQAAIDEANGRIAALQIGGVGGDAELTPEAREHAVAFNRFFRKGAEAGLAELQVKAALSTNSDPDGGYVVPEEMEATIDRVLGAVSAMRRVARVISISTGTYKKPVQVGGVSGGWVGEKEARPETAGPTLAELAFPAMELYANPFATQTMLDDARIDVAQWLADECGITFAELEGASFISGTGVNSPRGILQYDTVADASYAWGKLGFIATGVAADINDSSNNGVDALLDLVYALKQGYRSNASWMMNRTLQGKVRKLKSLGDTAEYLWQPSVQAGQPATLAGYPVIDDDNMPNVGSGAFPIAFGDFMRGYLIVDRFGIRVLRDPYSNKPYVQFYTTKRVGGGVQNFEAIKLLKCA